MSCLFCVLLLYTIILYNIYRICNYVLNLGPIFFNIFINDITTCLDSSIPFLYADDLKIVRVVKNNSDSEALQKDLDSINVWCKCNGMSLNIGKCSQVAFTRNKIKNNCQYYIEGHPLKRLDSIRDLGVVFDSELTFLPHMELVTAKSSKALGFVLRNAREFRNRFTKITLYNSFVRSILEYGSTVWRPHYATHTLRLERIQKRFVWHLAFAEGLLKKVRSYRERLKIFKVTSLAQRTDLLDLVFLHKLFNNNVDCPQLLSLFKIAIPSRYPRKKITRLLTVPFRKTNYGLNSPVCRLSRLYNDHVDLMDICFDPISKFRGTFLANSTS